MLKIIAVVGILATAVSLYLKNDPGRDDNPGYGCFGSILIAVVGIACVTGIIPHNIAWPIIGIAIYFHMVNTGQM